MQHNGENACGHGMFKHAFFAFQCLFEYLHWFAYGSQSMQCRKCMHKWNVSMSIKKHQHDSTSSCVAFFLRCPNPDNPGQSWVLFLTKFTLLLVMYYVGKNLFDYFFYFAYNVPYS